MNWYYSLIYFLSATKSSVGKLEEIKSIEFSTDALWFLHTCMLCRFAMAYY